VVGKLKKLPAMMMHTIRYEMGKYIKPVLNNITHLW
jgi:hypothetical protein